MRAKLLTAVAASGLIALGTGSTAGASVTIGQTFTPDEGCVAGWDRLQSGSPGSQYVVPNTGGITAWTVTSWSFQAPAAPDVPQLKFKVGRAAGGDNFTIVGQSGVVSPMASTLNTYPVQIPVQAGDIIGTHTTTDGFCDRTAPAYTLHVREGDLSPGSTGTFESIPFQFDVSAVLNPTNTFSVAGIRRNKKKGTATIMVTVPNPGELTASGKGVKAGGAAQTSKAIGAGTAKLTIRAKGKKKRKLNDTGKVKLNAKISYTPTGGTAGTQSRKVRLKKNL
jgi:hypothetical protein